MAYFGLFDGMEINGEKVDTSKLESEGKIIVGDEEWDAEDMITDEDRLQIFNDGAMRTKRDLLWGIDAFLHDIDKEKENDAKHSEAYYIRYKRLVGKFRDKVEKCVFPENLEDWWGYGFEVTSAGIALTLSHTDSYSIYADDSIIGSCDTEFELMHVPTSLLTVEQFAIMNGVTTTAVRQWIRRGKIRTAIKQGSEWRIPELAEVLERGYTRGHYERKEFLANLPEEFEFFNDYDYVDISQNKEHKELFDLCLSREFDCTKVPEEEWGDYSREMQMNQKEREKFELFLISSPFVVSADTHLASRG